MSVSGTATVSVSGTAAAPEPDSETVSVLDDVSHGRTGRQGAQRNGWSAPAPAKLSLATQLPRASSRRWRRSDASAPAGGAWLCEPRQRGRKGTIVKLKVINKAVNLIHQLRPLINRIRPRDKRLANQIVDAANSVVLNLGEAEYSDPGNRRARFHTAAGSAGEVRAGVQAAVGWGYVKREHAACALQELDSVIAILWKLTRG